MHIVICLVVGIVVFAVAVAALAGVLWVVVNVGGRIADALSWETRERIGTVVGAVALLLVAAILLFAFFGVGCEIAYSFGWISDCPLFCEPPTLEG